MHPKHDAGARRARGGVMANQPMYHEGMRRLQDLRETRPLADRL